MGSALRSLDPFGLPAPDNLEGCRPGSAGRVREAAPALLEAGPALLVRMLLGVHHRVDHTVWYRSPEAPPAKTLRPDCASRDFSPRLNGAFWAFLCS